jgi:hypothetical protein
MLKSIKGLVTWAILALARIYGGNTVAASG